MLLHLIPNNLAEKVDIVSIFQMEKLRLREVKEFTQGNGATIIVSPGSWTSGLTMITHEEVSK